MAKAPSPVSKPFEGFGPGALTFLRDLAERQDRAWFAEHKADYEREVRQPLGALVEAVSFAFEIHEIPLRGDAKTSLFRIHRDTRFSKDKRPYKTNAGAVLSRDGGKGTMGMVYIQIGGEDLTAPGGFVAAGFYAPQPPQLVAFRRAMAQAPQRWSAVREALGEAGLELSMGDALSRIPRGFEAQADSPIAADLKRRHFVVSRDLTAAELADRELPRTILDLALGARPLLDFGWAALARQDVLTGVKA